MRNSVLWLASALTATLLLATTVMAQPPDRGRFPGSGGPGGPGGRGGFGGPGDRGPLERLVDDMKLSEGKKDTALAAIRSHRENVRTMSDVTAASLLLKIKDIVSPDEYKKLQEATAKLQPPTRNGRRVTTEDVVERIMSYDKNKDGKVTKEELPERMQNLIEKGDTNKDGALDKEEIKALAAVLAKEESTSAGGRGGRGGPPAQPSPGSGLSLAAIERAVDDLKLSESNKEAVAAAVKARKDDAKKLTELVQAGLLLQMGDTLTGEEFTKFKVALDRQPGVGERQPGGRNGPPFEGRNGPPDRRGPPRP